VETGNTGAAREPGSIDPYAPAEMARRVATAGVHEARLGTLPTLTLAVIGGAFIALGSAFSTATLASTGAVGGARLLAGVAFGLGLVLVIVGGGSLFTSNNLLTMAWASGEVRTRKVLRNWGLVLLGNLVGVVATAVIVHVAGVPRFAGGAVGAQALQTAALKVGRAFEQDVALGILGNALVCLAVWLCFSARSTIDKVACIVLAMAALVTLNVDHVVANAYYLTAGLLAATDGAVVSASGLTAGELARLDLVGAAGNLVPVMLGNLIGGGLLVAAVYSFVYLAPSRGTRGTTRHDEDS
jgi:formate transporter